ncbi:TPX2 (targeting protein for Xklp2) protein family [Rhynchospora pubera]|uniref:TPX2 (Targeting protein for Xklp2) protein family n=1 Tax=Rhynchospora pubera TaxID=906938 RepID=A0AAV8C3I3_9POAL|nr:TPX2 (targeting protein for Xklp2) protein family [Rhynchospora pubera]
MMQETTKLLHSPPKSPKQGSSPVSKCLMRNSQILPSRVSNINQKQPQRKEQTFNKRVQGSPEKEHKQRTQGSPSKDEKSKYSPRPILKEKTLKAEKNFRLHSEERAVRRASFDYMVASKINSLEIIRRFEEKILKVIEEEEIKIMRKDMVPKAQLMPIFDRPFYPHRSTRPLTVPKEPSFLKQKCCIGGEFHRHFCFNTKAIK